MSIHLSPGRSTRPIQAARCGRPLLLLVVPLCLSLSYPALAAERKPTGAKQKPAAAEHKSTAPRLSAAEVVQRHAAARGGMKAWQAVKALSLSGKMDAGAGDSVTRSVRVARGPGAAGRDARRAIAAGSQKAEAEQQVQLPFKLAKQRPNKSRLEVEFAGKTAVQVYDGTNGWKLRPFLNRNDVQPFTPQESQAEAESADMGDPLIDAAAKGTKVSVEGIEQVEGSDAYKLKLTTKAGTVRHVFVDARTFLDVKVEGAPRRMDGKLHTVWVYQRDFRTTQGLKIPFVLETAVEGFPQTHKIVLEKVVVNPKLDPATFAKPTA